MTNRHGLEIRGTTASDAPGLAEMLGAAGLTVAAHELAARLSDLRQENGVALIALEWGPPSGIIVLHWYRTLLTARPVARVTTLHVDREARRRGIGRLLVKAGARAARQAGCDALNICVPPDAADLGAFCSATGFTRTGHGLTRSLRRGG